MKDVRCFEVYARLNVTETRFYFSIYLFHQRILFSLNIYHRKYICECNMRPKLVEKVLFHFYIGQMALLHLTLL